MKADFTPGAASRGCRSRAGPEPCARSRSPCAPPESFNAWSWQGVPAPPWQSPRRHRDKGRIPAASLGAITKALGLPPRSQGGAQGALEAPVPSRGAWGTQRAAASSSPPRRAGGMDARPQRWAGLHGNFHLAGGQGRAGRRRGRSCNTSRTRRLPSAQIPHTVPL